MVFDNDVTLEGVIRKKPAFGEVLRAARILAGRSQREAAKELRCERRSIQRWEAGEMAVHWQREEFILAVIARWIVDAAQLRGGNG